MTGMSRRVGIGCAVVALMAGAGVVCAGESPFRVSWVGADHVSGIYVTKDKAVVTVLVENLAETEQVLGGEFVFGPRKMGEVGEVEGGKEKVTTVVPIVEAVVGGGKSVKLEVPLAFAVAGVYELTWKHKGGEEKVRNSEGAELAAIFAPRGGGGKGAEPNVWIAVLPGAAVRARGFIQDYALRTTVRRFLLDEVYLFDPATKRVPVIGAALEAGAEDFAGLVKDMKGAKAELVLRVTVPLVEDPEAGSVEGFGKYVTDAVKRCEGTVKGLVIAPDVPAGFRWSAGMVGAYRKYYAAGLEAVRKADRGIVVLGMGDALVAANAGLVEGLEVDAFGVTDAGWQMALVREAARSQKKGVWVLPAKGKGGAVSASAAALAEGAEVIALPGVGEDRGVTAHLLGGAVMFQRVKAEGLPYVAVFQGDGYAVAAVAGLNAGTAVDVSFPHLARGEVEMSRVAKGGKVEKGVLVVADDATSMRVVDGAGRPVDCRVGDELRVPVEERVIYILQGANAEDLSALMRTAENFCVPMFEPTVTVGKAAEGGGGILRLRLRNIAGGELAGRYALIEMVEGKEKSVAGDTFVAVGAGKVLELPVEVAERVEAGRELVVAVEAGGVRQRCKVVVGK